jgi:SAM-dependent methyltransferase
MVESRWWTDFDAVIAAALPVGSRVLDVGCGDGGLVDRLGELGFDTLGVDPAAPAHPRLIHKSVEQLEDLSLFDAIVTVMVLHHAELDAVVAAFRRLLRPRGRLFVYDFDWSVYDDRAAAWLVARDSSGADNSVAGWQREHSGLHSGVSVKGALSAGFTPLIEVVRPYLARMLDRRGLEAAEHALIDAHMLPALGFWLISASAAAGAEPGLTSFPGRPGGDEQLDDRIGGPGGWPGGGHGQADEHGCGPGRAHQVLSAFPRR